MLQFVILINDVMTCYVNLVILIKRYILYYIMFDRFALYVDYITLHYTIFFTDHKHVICYLQFY